MIKVVMTEVVLMEVVMMEVVMTEVVMTEVVMIEVVMTEVVTMEVVMIEVTSGTVRRAKLQSNRHFVTTDKPTPSFLQVGYCPSCLPTNSVKALKGKGINGMLINKTS